MMRAFATLLVSATLLTPALAQQQGATPQPSGAQAQPPPMTGPSWAQSARVARPGGRLPGNPSIRLEQVAGDLIDPVNVTSPRDGSGRLFVVERHGAIRIIQNGKRLDEPFLDISDIVLSAFLEQGMYDIAFHPDFQKNGHVYVHFAELMRNGDSMIVRYTVSKDNPNRADPESAKVIMHLERPYANHNGGEIAFGPDGYLYIGSGDGGWEGDPLEAGQDTSTWLGKLLRINVNVPEDSQQTYAVPPSNPFARPVGLVQLFGIPEQTFANIHTRARPEIWAYGLRNPWKFHFDTSTGDLYLPDVGQNHWEEINVQPASSKGGENYGWDINMGAHCFPIEQKECPQVGILPVAEYSHDLGCSVIGLGVYRGCEVPGLDGVYLVGDFCSGMIWGIGRDERKNWVMQELLKGGIQITSGDVDDRGNLYVTSCNCNYGGPSPQENPRGALWRVIAGQPAPAGGGRQPAGSPQSETPQR